MTTNTKASLALVLGTIGGMVTMALHPTGRDIAGGGIHAALNMTVHSLALLAQPLILMGMLAVTVRFTAQRTLALAAYILFAWASVAIMLAATASGFIATSLLEPGGGHDGATNDLINNSLHYTGLINRAFAKVFVAFSSLAIIAWSVAMLRERIFSRALAVYGIVSGAAILIGILSGHLGISIHGFGSVVLGQGIWFIWLALKNRQTG